MQPPEIRKQDPILWELHENGPAIDLNGGASRILRQRLEARSVMFETKKVLSDVIGSLVQQNLLEGNKNHRGFYTELRLVDGVEVGPSNPFEFGPLHFGVTERLLKNKQAAKKVPKKVLGAMQIAAAPEPHFDYEHIIAWPVSKRLEVIRVLSATVEEDMRIFRDGIVNTI